MQNPQQNPVPAAAQAVLPPRPPQWQLDADILGLNAEERELHRLLCHVHNFTVAQYATLREEGYGTVHEMRGWKHKDIYKLLTNLSDRPANRGGRRYGDKRIRQVQAISWFVNDATSRGVLIDLNIYEQDPDTCIQNAALAADHAAKDSTSANKPEKFAYKSWITWEESVDIYLESIISSSRGAPLSYVIRKDLPTGTNHNDLDATQQKVYTPPLHGFAFDIDTKQVLTLIKELCLGTESEVWIQNIKCGRQAMQALRTHYDGPDEAKKRTLEAEAKLKSLFYKHEYTFPFEKFITALQGHFKVFERYGMPMYEQKKVETLFEKCQNTHPEFKLEVGIGRSQHDTFLGAVTYLKTAVARIFPSDGRKGVGRQRQVSSATTVNGVDLSDFNKRYSNEEVKKIKSTPEGKKAWFAFLNNPKRKRATEKYKRKGGFDNRRIRALEKRLKSAGDTVSGSSTPGTSETSSAQGLNDKEQRKVAAVINGVMNASRHNAQSQGQIQFPLNGRTGSIRSAQRSQNGGASVSSELTFDHLGNPL